MGDEANDTSRPQAVLPTARSSGVSSRLSALHRIVEEVSASASLEQALEIIVSRVQEVVGVDVCSVYLSDHHTGHHVLMATKGLNPESVGRVRLPFDEGLVGLVAERAEPVNMQDAPTHPRFLPVPDCGEEPYNAFLGVPIIHQGEPQGVLVVQQVARRQFVARDVAFLVTLAAQLAGGIALAKAKGAIDRLTHSRITRKLFIEGVSGAPGVAVGTGIVLYAPTDLAGVPDRVPVDAEAEISAFRGAVAGVVEDFRRIGTELADTLSAEDRALFDAYALMANSETFLDATTRRIRAGNWAPGALRMAIAEHAQAFEAMEDDYLRVRADDIRQIGRRLLAFLLKEEPRQLIYPEHAILVGDNLSPVDLANVPKERLAGIVCTQGSAYSHLSILARAFGIPAVVGLARNVPIGHLDGKQVIVDGSQGRIYVSPPLSIRREYDRVVDEQRKLSRDLERLRDLPAETRDGIRIPLYTNAGLFTDLSHSLAVGAEGVGLYRTELPFMTRDSFPSAEEQCAFYRKVLQTFAPRPVILRTLDIGGDKVLPYFTIQEDNPFLGWRGIRVSLDHPEIFLTQLRAMLEASAGLNNMSVLLPMVSRVEELDRAIELIRRTHRELNEEGIEARMPPCGVMIEVPAAVYQAESLARRVDFLSVGTNDLTQYLLAVDRTNAQVARWFDALHPAVLHAIKQVVDAGHANGKPVSICGEAAGDPVMAILFIGMGVDSLSLSAGDLPRIKWVIRSFSRTEAIALLHQALACERVDEIRALLTRALETAGLGALCSPSPQSVQNRLME